MAKRRHSCTVDSRKNLRERYPFVGDVEKKVPYSFISQDLFEFADLIAFNSAEVVLVQVTSGSNHAHRRTKILANAAARLWIAADGRRILIQSWAKQGARGARKLWTLREEEINEESFT